jgi:predicted nucleic acid-binding Zn ribbon protein
MHITVSQSNVQENHLFAVNAEADTSASVYTQVHAQHTGIRNSVKSHCWYCNKALYSFRTYCSTECREAMYDDTERAKERRMIFGCQC